MINVIKSRRGIAIEIAIGAMFVMIALSIVLLSISGMQSAQGNRDAAEFQEKIDMYELTDKVLAGTEYDEGGTYKDYTVTVAQVEGGNTYNYTVTKTNSEGESTLVLTFTVKVDNNTKQITSWGK